MTNEAKSPKPGRHLVFKIHATLNIAINLFFWGVWLILEHAQTKLIWPIWATGILAIPLALHYYFSYHADEK